VAIEDARGRMLDTVGEVQGKAQHIFESVSQEVKYKTSQLKEIGSTMIDEQSSSLEQGVEEAKDVLSS
jgi:hypothetical protein